jgi:hypothetical protein
MFNFMIGILIGVILGLSIHLYAQGKIIDLDTWQIVEKKGKKS